MIPRACITLHRDPRTRKSTMIDLVRCSSLSDVKCRYIVALVSFGITLYFCGEVCNDCIVLDASKTASDGNQSLSLRVNCASIRPFRRRLRQADEV